MEKYPDVTHAVEIGIVKDAKDHFARFGYFEHRRPYYIQVQEDWYVEQYPDIKKAIKQKDFKSGQEHFETNGFREGRMPYPEFELVTLEKISQHDGIMSFAAVSEHAHRCNTRDL